jgi:hypothetical protein
MTSYERYQLHETLQKIWNISCELERIRQQVDIGISELRTMINKDPHEKEVIAPLPEPMPQSHWSAVKAIVEAFEEKNKNV